MIFIEDKVFELLTEMYSKMTEQFKEVNSKIDKKADKSDIVRLENDLQPKQIWLSEILYFD